MTEIGDGLFRLGAERFSLACMRRTALRGKGLELQVSYGPGPLGHDWWHLTLLGQDATTGRLTLVTSLPVSPEILEGAHAGHEVAADFLVRDLEAL